jgi:cellulose synthase/poly-beta-1,6-N-acetylglucosamine synthase-like glycosyltransferase
MMVVLCLAGLCILAHAYVGYPLSLALMRLVRRRPLPDRQSSSTPTVALVISAHNEERVLGMKIENSLDLDYPSDSLRIVVVSDASTDATETIARGYAARGVVLEAFAERRGKVACLNDVIPGLDAEIVVMSDANSLYRRDAIRMLVRHFEDPEVGCVCGELLYVNPRALAAGEGERTYWNYERAIKRMESALGSLLGANGAIYAYRRRLFRRVDPLMFCDDLIPIRIRLEGCLALYDPQAVCTEEAATEETEFGRRRRHASFGLRSMLCLGREAVRARDGLILYQCLSHRVLRWLGGLALGMIALSTPFLPAPARLLAFWTQGLFYGAALLGFMVDRAGLRSRVLYLPYYFMVLTVAGAAGLVSFVARSDKPYWDSRR